MNTLFVVEDNKIDQYIMRHNLVRCPFFNKVFYYDEGLPLINYLKKYKTDSDKLPDTIFLDLGLPEYSGWKVLDALEAIYQELAKKINVYIVSASIMSADVLKARNYDFVRQFISKPFTKNNLMAISRELGLSISA